MAAGVCFVLKENGKEWEWEVGLDFGGG